MAHERQKDEDAVRRKNTTNKEEWEQISDNSSS
jgi:hypothetical protein